MPGVKTNEREGTRAVLRHSRMSATKARQVLDLIRGQDADRAAEILALSDREAARVVAKVLASAVANAVHNDGLDAEELFVSACYADEGGTLKRWRPRARGRETRIRKRTCHVTIIVSRMPDERIARRRAERAATASQRSRRVASSRRRRAEAADTARVARAAEQVPEESVDWTTSDAAAEAGEEQAVVEAGAEAEAGAGEEAEDGENADAGAPAEAGSVTEDEASAEEKGE